MAAAAKDQELVAVLARAFCHVRTPVVLFLLMIVAYHMYVDLPRTPTGLEVPHSPVVATFDASTLSSSYPSGCANPAWTMANTGSCLMPRINGVIYDGPQNPTWDPAGNWSKWVTLTHRNTSPIIGVEVAHVPGTDAYLFIGRSSAISFGPNGDVVAGVYNLTTNEFRNVTTNSNPFCGGIGITYDGRIMVAGGTTQEQKNGSTDGRDAIRLYDYHKDPYVLNDSVYMRYTRWYPTVTLLTDNNMFIIGGTASATETSSPHDWFESWLASNETKQPIPRHPIEPTFLPEMGKQFYPSNFVLPSGEVFILQDQYSRIINHRGFFRTVTDPVTGVDSPVRAPLYPSKWKTQFPFLGTAVMTALTYENDYGSVDIIMFGGGLFPDTEYAEYWCPTINNTAKTTPANRFSYRLTISVTHEDSNDWEYSFSDWVEEDMGIPRVGGDSVLLPNGDVVLVGGAQTGCACGIRDGVSRGNYPALWPVLYQPDGPVGQRYTVMAASTIARMYHGTAVLTTNGTIMVQGCDGCEKNALVSTAPFWDPSPDERWEFRIQEFFPPYAVDVQAKPEITAINGGTSPITTVAHGDYFTITWRPLLEDSTNVTVTKVSLVAPSSVTHGFNTNQRVVFLQIIGRFGNTLSVRVPQRAGALPPQTYMVFVMNGKTYSQAWWVNVTKAMPAMRGRRRLFA